MAMSNEKKAAGKKESGEGVTGTMKNGETCIDCLYCKVSKESTEKCRLCFCSETKKKEKHKEHYWITRPACKKFEDMTV